MIFQIYTKKREKTEAWIETRNKKTAEIIREIKKADRQAEKRVMRISKTLNSKPVRVGASRILFSNDELKSK